VTVADFNGDGKTDIAVVNCGEDGNCVSSTEGSVGILLGNGDGTFQSVVTYPSGGYGTLSVVAGDVNGDGKIDIVVTNICGSDNPCAGKSTIGVLLGNRDGTFQQPLVYPTGGFPSLSLAIADLNRDGNLDVVVGNCDSSLNCFTGSGIGTVSVLLGKGDGTFVAHVLYPSGGLNAIAVAIADVNGDGKPDIVVANCGVANNENADCSENQVLSVLLGDGDGTFQAPLNTTWSGPTVRSVAVADVNGDGKPDALVAAEYGCTENCNQGGIIVLLGNGDGTFQPGVTYETGGNDAGSVVVSDLNRDGILDLMVASGGLGVLLGNGNGTFQAATNYGTGGNATTGIVAADINGDGIPDVIASDLCALGSNPCSGLVGVLLNNTPFCTTPPVITVSTTPTALWPPNGKIVPVTVSGTITDTGSGCTVRTATYAVKDEYGEVQPSGSVTWGSGGAYSFTVLLQASRLGTDLDGRLYTVTVSASNNAGKTGSQAGTVIVPHDRGR
jgi:hypothetical protein